MDSGSTSPPSYTDLYTRVTGAGNSEQMDMVDSKSSIIHPKLPPEKTASSIIFDQLPVEERHHGRSIELWKKFNCGLGSAGVIAMSSSLYVQLLQGKGNCTMFSPGVNSLMRNDKRHDIYLYAAIILILLSVAKFCRGHSNGHFCYMLLVGLTSFTGTMACLTLALDGFYMKCARDPLDMYLGLSPAEQIPFMETNVFEPFKYNHPYGAYIFMVDLFNSLLFGLVFLSSVGYFCYKF